MNFSSGAVSYQEHLKDATYITVSSRPTPGSEPSARIVKSMSLKGAIGKAQIVRLGESSGPGPVKPGAFEVNKFFRRLSFKRQVGKLLRYHLLRTYFNCVLIETMHNFIVSDNKEHRLKTEHLPTGDNQYVCGLW